MDDKETARQRWVKQTVEAWHEDIKPTAIAWWTDLLKDWRLHLITAVAVLLLVWSLWPSKAEAETEQEKSPLVRAFSLSSGLFKHG